MTRTSYNLTNLVRRRSPLFFFSQVTPTLALLLLALLISISSLNAAAQVRCKLEHYSTLDGLIHESVTSLLKGKDGYLWIGTWGGLNRFDGHDFSAFRSATNCTFNMGNSRIDQIVEDGTDYLWLRAYDLQVYRFNKHNERFESLADILQLPEQFKLAVHKIHSFRDGELWLNSKDQGLFYVPDRDDVKRHYIRFASDRSSENRLPSNYVNFVKADSRGKIWVATSKGIVSIDQTLNDTYTVERHEKQALLEKSYCSMAEDTDNIYFGSNDGILTVIKKSNGVLRSVRLGNVALNNLCASKVSSSLYISDAAGCLWVYNRNSGALQSQALSRFPLHLMYEDIRGAVWIEPNERGVYRYDPLTKKAKLFLGGAKYAKKHDDGHFNIFEDQHNRLWVSMKGEGFGYYSAEIDTVLTHYQGTDGDEHEFPRLVYGVLYDKLGYLWMKTEQRGLEKLSLLGDDFQSFLLNQNGGARLENEVRGIMVDRKNRIWLGSKGDDLRIFKDGQEIFDVFLNRPRHGLGAPYVIFEDSEYNVWIGTKGKGLFKATPVTAAGDKYHLTHYPALSSSANTVARQIYSIAEDDKKRIWIGTFDGGIFVANSLGNGSHFRHLRGGTFLGSGNNYTKIRIIAPKKDGSIWVGTTDGLMILKDTLLRSHQVFTTAYYYNKYNNDASLGNNDIQYILHDRQQKTWICTSGGGLNQAISRDPLRQIRFRKYTQSEGLSSDYILSAIEDRQGRLWLSSPGGLSCFDVSSATFANYSSNDGIPESSFSEASRSMFLNGKLVFGMMKGYIIFDPSTVRRHRDLSPLAFTDFLINGKSITTEKGIDSKYLNINYRRQIVLAHNENNFNINFTLLNFKDDGKTRYSYRLLGLDTSWQKNSTVRRASFTNISPGRYTFQLKYSNSSDNSNQPLRTLDIVVLSPWWFTWWAYIIYALIFAVFALYVRKNILTVLRLRQQVAVEHQLADLKANFFTNISHELRTPLTLIVNPVEELLVSERLTERGQQYLEIVHRNARRMERFMNKLLDLRKAQNGSASLNTSYVDVLSFSRIIADYFRQTADAKSVSIFINSNVNEIWTWIDVEKMDVVLYNLISNALKFSPAHTEIIIDLHVNNNKLTITVQDAGPGVDPSHLNQLFDLYFSDPGKNNENRGIGIGLSLCREYVQLHKGLIKAFNNENGGLSVEITLNILAEMHDHAEKCEGGLAREHLSPLPALNTSERREDYDKGKPSLLLVEDNCELRFFLETQLAVSYHVHTAVNGVDGLRLAKELLPDIILSDVMMPEMNGIEMLAKLKADKNTSHIPLILLTAKNSVQSQVKGLEEGADGYITKPFNMSHLRATLSNVVNGRKLLFENLQKGKVTIDLEPAPVSVSSRDKEFLQEVLKIVERGMTDTDFNIDMVAESIGMGRSSFYKKFKSLTDQAPVEFVREMRLKRAVQYMEAGDCNISEIAYKSGFNNPKYFSTCFKERYKLSPKEYMKTSEN